MDFTLNAEQRIVQEQARRFAEQEIRPTMQEDEKNHTYRPNVVRKMGELGFFGCCIPEEYGGNGMGYLESVLMTEQLAMVSPSWRLPFNLQNIGPAVTVNQFGTREQKEKFIPGWVSGEQIGFFAITEPNAGSDVNSMKTTAKDMGDHWELNGQKMWISNAPVGNTGLVYAVTDREKKNKGISCFIIDLSSPALPPPRLKQSWDFTVPPQGKSSSTER